MSRDGAAVDVADLAADVARVREAVRLLLDALNLPHGYDDADIARVRNALAAPAPDPAPTWLDGTPIAEADPTPPPAPLPGPEAEAARYANLPPPVLDAIRAILQARAVGDLGYAAANNVVYALAAWARALPPTLDAETQALMHEACILMDDIGGRLDARGKAYLYAKPGWCDRRRAELQDMASRLCAAAGPPP